MNKINNYAVEVEDLTVSYNSKPVLWDIDLKIPRGKLVAIIGPNGAGKTTLIKSMLNLIKPVSGAVRFPLKEQFSDNNISRNNFYNSKNILSYLPFSISDKIDLDIFKNTLIKSTPIAYVPQSSSVDWDFPATVKDIVLMGCYGKLGWIKRPSAKDKELAYKMLSKVNMQDYSNRQISQLSGGQQQRVFLARALVQEAEIYFMDEPFKGVDAQTEKTIIDLLKELKNQGKTVIVVHHDLQTVKEYFDWVTLINIQLIDSGEVNNTFTDENLKKTYRSSGSLIKEEI